MGAVDICDRNRRLNPSNLLQACGVDELVLPGLQVEDRDSHFRECSSYVTGKDAPEPIREYCCGARKRSAVRTARTNSIGASEPTRVRSARKSGSGSRNRIGARAEARKRRQPLTGLVAKPAHKTSAFMLGRPSAAIWMASGVENDSATRANGSDVGAVSRTRGASWA